MQHTLDNYIQDFSQHRSHSSGSSRAFLSFNIGIKRFCSWFWLQTAGGELIPAFHCDTTVFQCVLKDTTVTNLLEFTMNVFFWYFHFFFFAFFFLFKWWGLRRPSNRCMLCLSSGSSLTGNTSCPGTQHELEVLLPLQLNFPIRSCFFLMHNQNGEPAKMKTAFVIRFLRLSAACQGTDKQKMTISFYFRNYSLIALCSFIWLLGSRISWHQNSIHFEYKGGTGETWPTGSRTGPKRAAVSLFWKMSCCFGSYTLSFRARESRL